MKIKKRKVIFGDIHGNYVGIQKILNSINYNPDFDKLIFVGDYIDGFVDDSFDPKKTIDLLLTLNNSYFILGNHDYWMRDWILMEQYRPNLLWYNQGGSETLKSYGITELMPYNAVKHIIPQSHVDFLNNLNMSYIDEDLVVVHGGFTSSKDMRDILNEEKYVCNVTWDREFYKTTTKSLLNKYVEYFGNKIFICGHTPFGPIINKTPNYPTRILIDGGSKGGGSLYAIIFNDDKTYNIINEK